MNKLLSLPIAVACCGLPMLAACTRTSDGSIVVARPIGVPGFMRPAFTAEPVPPPAHPVAGQFPQPPAQPLVRRSRPPATRVPVVAAAVKPPFQRSDPQRPLTCRNAFTTSGRVRMVCN